MLTDMVLEPSLNMLEACRTCLRLIDVDTLTFYEIEADDLYLSKESCRYKLLNIVPEMALNITPKSMICTECHRNLEALFDFKAKCLKTEDIIVQYLKAKPDVDIKNFDLKNVSIFNGVDIKITKDVAAEAPIQPVIVKEEEKCTDIAQEFVAAEENITVVKHEVDNYVPESFEFVDPENMVLESYEEVGNNSKLKCPIGSKEFNDETSLNVQVQSKDGKYECEYCDKCFTHKTLLNRHIDKHIERLYECKTCQKKFARQDGLARHQRRHAGIKNFECKYCSKRFFESIELKWHLASHTNDKPHRCQICDKRFIEKFQLKNHMRIHTGERPYECETCQMKFTRQYILTKHQKIHAETKKFECEYCKRHFVRKKYLLQHMHVHKQEQSFLCHVCKVMFCSKRNVKRHILRIHKDVDINRIVIEEVKKEETQEK